MNRSICCYFCLLFILAGQITLFAQVMPPPTWIPSSASEAITPELLEKWRLEMETAKAQATMTSQALPTKFFKTTSMNSLAEDPSKFDGYILLDDIPADSLTSGRWQIYDDPWHIFNILEREIRPTPFGLPAGGTAFYQSTRAPIPGWPYGTDFYQIGRTYNLGKTYLPGSKIGFFLNCGGGTNNNGNFAGVRVAAANHALTVGTGSDGFFFLCLLYPRSFVKILDNGFFGFVEIPITWGSFSQVTIYLINYTIEDDNYAYLDHIMFKGITPLTIQTVEALPDTLWLDRNGVGSITFHATTSEEMYVTFKVQSGSQVLAYNTVHSDPANSADWAWNGQILGGMIAPGSYTIIASGPTNFKEDHFEVKKKCKILSLISKPQTLWVDRFGNTSGIIFRATTSEATSVTFSVQPPTGSSISLGSVNTEDVNGVPTAGVKWLAQNLNLESGSYTIIARIEADPAEKEEVTFPVQKINADACGYGTWLTQKDPAKGIDPEPAPVKCPPHLWEQLIDRSVADFRTLTISDPVNVIFGNFLHSEVDLQLKAKNSLVLARVYNSLDPHVGAFGRGWSSPYLSRLELSSNRAVFVNSDGSRLLFTSTDGQTYTGPEKTELTLSYSPDTEFWTVKHPNSSEWSFDAQGNLLRLAKACCGLGATDANLCEYDQAGHLRRVSNPAGQTLTFASDINGRIVSVTDNTGRVCQYSYSSDGGLLSFTDPLNRTTVYQYDEDGFLASIQGPGNRVTSIKYADNRVSKITNPVGGVSQFSWDETDPKLTVTDADGTNHEYRFSPDWRFSSYSIPALGITKTFQTTATDLVGYQNSLGAQETFSYNAAGLLERKTDSLGNSSHFEYHPTLNRLTKKVDALGREWDYSWCQRGNLILEKDPMGGISSATFDAHNNRLSKIDPLGRLQRWIYDSSGNYLLQAIDPEGGISSFSYDNRGNLVSSSDQLGRTTQFQFDILDRLTKTVYPDGRFVEVEYNEAGNVSVRRDNLGRETHYIYDLADRLTTLIRLDGTTFNYAFNAGGQKISETDSLGRVTWFEYSPIGLLTKTIYPDGSFKTMNYDTESRLVSKTNELGQTVNLEYDQLGRPLATIDPSGARWESQYDNVGRKIADKDPLNRVTAYQFDNLDRITKVIRPDSSFTTNYFDAVGNLLSTVDALGNNWSWVYNNLNLQVRAIQPNGASSTTAFDAAGHVVSETDSLNRVTRHAFDLGGRRTATTDALGNIWQNFYDSAGRLIATKDPMGAVSSMTYDIMDRVVSQSDPLGNSNSFEFDAAGRRVAKTDAMGRRSITAFDLRDRATSDVDPEGHTVSFGYNLAGQRVSLIDGANRTWRWELDSLGRVISDIDPIGNINRYGFDAVGNRTSLTNARNQTTTFVVDSMNRMTQIGYPDGTLATMAYDLEGRELSRSSPAGSVVKTWDSIGNLTSETFGPWGKKWQFSFDLAGNRISAIDPEGQVFKYTVDKLNRVVSLNPPEKGDEIKFSFDAAGRLITEERPGVKTTSRFDIAGRLLELKHERDHGKEKIVAFRKYQYNSVGNRISEENEAGEISNYSFNGSDWLSRVQYPDGQLVSYGLNGAGDRLNETTETPTFKKIGRNTVIGTDTVVVPFGYDPAGRMISRASDTFVFDSDGNQVSAVENGDETRYFWTPDNRLARVEKDIECPKHGKKKCGKCPQAQSFTTAEEYGYLPNDWRRITRKADGLQFVSVFENADESDEYQMFTYKDKKGHDGDCKCNDHKKTHLKLIRQFIGGPGTDDLVSTKYHGRTLEMLKDGLGSTIALTNRGGVAVSRMNYDSWGNLRFPDKPGHGLQPCRESDLDDLLDKLEGKYTFGDADHDSWWYGRHHSKNLVPYLFAGRRFDSFSGLYNNRERYYSSKVGRFITKDPIGFDGGLNLWNYVGNNPVRWTDPSGLIIWPEDPAERARLEKLFQQNKDWAEQEAQKRVQKLMEENARYFEEHPEALEELGRQSYEETMNFVMGISLKCPRPGQAGIKTVSDFVNNLIKEGKIRLGDFDTVKTQIEVALNRLGPEGSKPKPEQFKSAIEKILFEAKQRLLGK